MIKLVVISFLGVGALGVLFGAILAFAAKKLKVERDPRIDEVEEALPGANCGACGYAGCSVYAKAIIEEDAPINLCAPGGSETIEAIAKITGADGTSGEKLIASVCCKGDKETVEKTGEYKGIKTCSAIHSNIGGDKACAYGCLGYADCVKVCPFNAIYMKENGLPEVDEDKCTGCGICVKACPRNIIKLIPQKAYFIIKCVSPDFGAAVSKVCKKGCIGCSICVKVNENQGIEMDGKLPIVDYNVFKGDSIGAEKCPTKVIDFNEKKFKK